MSAHERRPVEFGTIVVCGGGCYGSYYVRQLDRARRAGAARWERLLIVDRDPACAAAALGAEIAARRWTEFFADWLGERSATPERAARDAIVPSPLMPHLMFDWIAGRARERWPDREVRLAPLPRPPAIPWQRAGHDGTHFVSFAEWMCPVNCIEPVKCPAIRAERTWSMPPAVRGYVDACRAAGDRMEGPVVLACTHRAYGVGMIDVGDVLAGDALVRDAGTAGPCRVLIGTVSHCHGALGVLEVGAAEPAPAAR